MAITGIVPQKLGKQLDPAGLQALEDLQKQEEHGQVSADDFLKYINSGQMQRALQNNPANQAKLQQLMMQTARKASTDQGQLGALAQRFGLGNSGMQGTLAANQSAQAFNPLAANTIGTPSRIGAIGADGGADAQLGQLAQLGGGGGFFEDKVFAIMVKVVEDFQKQIEQRLEKLQQQAQAAAAQGGQGGQGGQDTGAESRNIEFEKIKYDMQKLSQMQQAMSNILNSMDDLAKNAIRHIKAG